MTQLLLDLIDTAHDLIDLLMGQSSAPSPGPLPGYLDGASLAYGFTTSAVEHVPDPGRNQLRDRVLALMTSWSPQEPGPVHELAKARPTLLDDLRQVADDRDIPVRQLKNVIETLLTQARTAETGAR